MLATLQAGELYYLSISKKISQLDQVSQAGRSSDLTRADHRGRGALQSCSSCCPVSASCKRKIKASSLHEIPAVTSVGYFSMWEMKVEEVKAKHSFVSAYSACRALSWVLELKLSRQLLFPPSTVACHEECLPFVLRNIISETKKTICIAADRVIRFSIKIYFLTKYLHTFSAYVIFSVFISTIARLKCTLSWHNHDFLVNKWMSILFKI